MGLDPLKHKCIMDKIKLCRVPKDCLISYAVKQQGASEKILLALCYFCTEVK